VGLTLIWTEIHFMLPDHVREYLSFTRKERLGIVSLVFIMIALLIIPELFKKNSLRINKEELRKYEQAIASLNQKKFSDSAFAIETSPQKFSRKFAAFDPNELDNAGWKSFGLNDRVIETINHYRKKGGIFKHPEDLRKIYGLDEAKIQIMMPYVRIRNKNEEAILKKKNYKHENLQFAHNHDEQEKKKNIAFAVLDVNSADSIDFLNLNGIGPKLAGRIVHFRQKLGGFYSLDQIGETFGLTDSVFRSIKPFLMIADHARDSLKKIDINHCQFAELSQHPYIRYSVAKILIEFRNQHGPFMNLQELGRLHTINREMLEKIIPYLKI
jgi:competence protein ComEA